MPKFAEQSDNYKFNVVQLQLKHPVTGELIVQYGNFREDTGACLGVTSDNYGLIQNEDLVDSAIKALDARGLTNYKSKIIVTGDGQRMYARFSFENKQLKNSVGDVFGYQLTLVNSFDRSKRASFELGFTRLVCSNGAVTLEKEFGVTAKHSSGVSIEFVGKAVDKAIEKGRSALSVYDKLATIPITELQGLNILKHLELQKFLSGSLREGIAPFWLNPKRQEDKARTLYNLYNAVTEFLTHQIQKDRFEYSQKVANNVLLKLYNAAQRADQLAKLIADPPADVQVKGS